MLSAKAKQLWVDGRRLPPPYYAIIPHKAALAIIPTLLALLAIQLGGSPLDVGVVAALTTAGDLAGSLVWARQAASRRKRILLMVLGYWGILAGCLLMMSRLLLAIFVAAFSVSFLSSSTYYAALFSVGEEYGDKLSENVGRFESVGGWAWVGGLAAGCVAATTFSPDRFAAVLAAASFLSMLCVSKMMGYQLTKHLLAELKRCASWVESSVEKVARAERASAELASSDLRKLISRVVSQEKLFANALAVDGRFYATQAAAFFSFGIVYSQLVLLMKAELSEDSLVFGVLMLGSAASATAYSAVGRRGCSENGLAKSYAARVLLFASLAALPWLPHTASTAVLVVFPVASGLTWAYIQVFLNASALKRSCEAVGLSRFVAGLGYIAGSLVGGLAAIYVGYPVAFSAAAAILAIDAAVVSRSVGRA